MRKALIPGTFDPVTVGHLDLITWASDNFDEVTVGIFSNPDKTCLFTPEERMELLRLATQSIPRVRIVVSDGYTADYAKKEGFAAIVRGYRSASDLTYEQQMATFNQERGGIDTLLLKTPEELTSVSSTLVRQRLAMGADVGDLVPPATLETLLHFYRQKGARL